jgi:hypothetical protein
MRWLYQCVADLLGLILPAPVIDSISVGRSMDGSARATAAKDVAQMIYHRS